MSCIRSLINIIPLHFSLPVQQEDLDKQTLLFQNRKLTERIELRRKAEAELLGRIEQLEKRQTTDDAVLCVVNRWGGGTVGQNSQELGRKYWATRSSVRSHCSLVACSALLASLAHSLALGEVNDRTAIFSVFFLF